MSLAKLVIFSCNAKGCMGMIFSNWSHFSPIFLAFVATTFTWLLTALGSATVFFFKSLNQKFFDGMLGFTGGVMIAASFWSLLNPAIEMSLGSGIIKALPATIGFLIGGGFLWGLDKLIPHLHINHPISEAEGLSTNWHGTTLLVLAITLHNIPEGLAVGVLFGAAAQGVEGANFSGAMSLAIGIGIQNFPEGMSVAFPLRRLGMSRGKSFFYGQLSAIVEPIAGVVGAMLASHMIGLLPYALSFAAGAMIYVVVEEVIPESHKNNYVDSSTLGLMLGFAVMMILDVGLS